MNANGLKEVGSEDEGAPFTAQNGRTYSLVLAAGSWHVEETRDGYSFRDVYASEDANATDPVLSTIDDARALAERDSLVDRQRGWVLARVLVNESYFDGDTDRIAQAALPFFEGAATWRLTPGVLTAEEAEHIAKDFELDGRMSNGLWNDDDHLYAIPFGRFCREKVLYLGWVAVTDEARREARIRRVPLPAWRAAMIEAGAHAAESAPAA